MKTLALAVVAGAFTLPLGAATKGDVAGDIALNGMTKKGWEIQAPGAG